MGGYINNLSIIIEEDNFQEYKETYFTRIKNIIYNIFICFRDNTEEHMNLQSKYYTNFI